MKIDTEILSADDPKAIAYALEVLQGSGLVAFPTDTVYGLGARVFDAKAVKRLYKVKVRDEAKAIPVLLASTDEVAKVAVRMPPNARQLAARFWPGPLTLVVWRRRDLPAEISADDSIGIRVPDQRIALSLLTAAGPLAVTSANISGEPNICTADEVYAALGGRIHLILDGGKTHGGNPSTVVDCTRAVPKVLRPGPISEDDIISTFQ